MLRFAWLHELGHAVLGHARFVAQHRRLLELREFGEPGQPNLDAQLQQALELEADLFAVRLSFWQILHEREVFRLEVDLRGDLPSRLVWLRIACAAMAVLWTSVEGRLPEENASHPPPALRYYNMCTMIDTLARALGLDFTAIGASAAMYVERLNIDCPPFWDLRAADASFFDSPLVQRVRAYQARMQQAVANVREQVDEGEYVSEHPIVGRPPIGFDSGYYRRMKLERVTRFRRLQEGKAKFPGGAEG
jgi:hypothetical protein